MEVIAVSVADATAATTTQAMRMMTSAQDWALMKSAYPGTRSSEELAHAPVLVYADDRLAQQRGHAQHGDRGPLLVRRDRDRVGHNPLVDRRLAQPFHRAFGQDGVGGGEDDPLGAVALQGS